MEQIPSRESATEGKPVLFGEKNRNDGGLRKAHLVVAVVIAIASLAFIFSVTVRHQSLPVPTPDVIDQDQDIVEPQADSDDCEVFGSAKVFMDPRETIPPGLQDKLCAKAKESMQVVRPCQHGRTCKYDPNKAIEARYSPVPSRSPKGKFLKTLDASKMTKKEQEKASKTMMVVGCDAIITGKCEAFCGDTVCDTGETCCNCQVDCFASCTPKQSSCYR